MSADEQSGAPAPTGERGSHLASRLRPHDQELLRRAAWTLPRETWAGIVGAPLIAGLVAVVVAALNTSATMEYHGVAVGSLLTLAGIVPAVVTAAAAGKPVTRLDGGRLMLAGLTGAFVGAYTLAFAIALAFPLLALLGVWHWAQEPGGLGIGVFGLLCTTIWTPVLLVLLSSRLHPLRSTLLAVSQVVHTPGAAAAEQRSRQFELVKDLRDLAINESGSGDRRAVQHRMVGLATVGSYADVELADLALQELGVVTQHVLSDRDLALAGVHLIVSVAEGRAGVHPEVTGAAADELIGLWRDAHAAGASPAVAAAATEGVTRISLICPQPGGRALARLLREMGRCARTDATGLHAQLAVVEELRPIVSMAEEDGVLTPAWAELLSALGPQGFRPLVQRLAVVAEMEVDTVVGAARRALLDAATSLVIEHAAGSTLPATFRTSVRTLVAEGTGRQLVEIADVLVDRDDIGDDIRAALLGELLLRLPQMRPRDLEALLSVLAGERARNENLRLAPHLLPRLDDLVTRLIMGRGPQGTEDTAGSRDRYVNAVITMITDLWVSHVRSADEDDDESPVDVLVARLLGLARRKKLSGPALDTLRRRTAGQIQSLHQRLPERALDEAGPLMPFLISSWDEYALAWLVWWEREARSDFDLPSADVPHLLRMRERAEASLGAPLPIPPTDAFHGTTYAEGVHAIDQLLRSRLRSEDEEVKGAAWHRLRTWLDRTTDENRKVQRTRAIAGVLGVDESELLTGETFALAKVRAFLEGNNLLVEQTRPLRGAPDHARTLELGALLTPDLLPLVEHCEDFERNILRCAVEAWVRGVCAHDVDVLTPLSTVTALLKHLTSARGRVARVLADATTIPTTLAVQMTPVLAAEVFTLFQLLHSQLEATEGPAASAAELDVISVVLCDSLRRNTFRKRANLLRALAHRVVDARGVVRRPEEVAALRDVDDALRTYAETHLDNPESGSVYAILRSEARARRQGQARPPRQPGPRPARQEVTR